MRAGNRNLGLIQDFKIGAFLLPAAGGNAVFNFNAMPREAPGGGFYDVLDITLKFPAGAIQFPVGVGSIVTARSLWAIFQRLGLTLGSNSPQAKFSGPQSPEKLFSAMPGHMVADFLALHSRSQIADVDGLATRKTVVIQPGVVSTQPVPATRQSVEHIGWAFTHGPLGNSANFGVNNKVDLIFPLGRRNSDFVYEDPDDAAIPSNWLSGLALGPQGVEFEPAQLFMDFATTVEGGALLTLATGAVVEVWCTAVVRRMGRGALPTLPVMRWNAPPANTSEVTFVPGIHFWSGFGAADTTGRGNNDANLNVNTFSVDTINYRLGNNVSNYPNATEYLKSLNRLCGQVYSRPAYAFGVSDDPIQPSSMALVRERMGILPVGIPLPTLLAMGSDALNDLLVSFTNPTPAGPWQLQCVYPVYTAEGMNMAARASGIPNAIPVDAVDSYSPEDGVSPLIPKAIRQAVQPAQRA